MSERKSPVPKPIFLSYSRKDQENGHLKRLVSALTEHGARFWMWETEMIPGQSVISEISHRIDQAHGILIALSANSAGSWFGPVEWGIAMNREVRELRPRVCVLRIDDVPIPSALSHCQIFDLEADFDSVVAGLTQALLLGDTEPLAEFDIAALHEGQTILTVSADIGAALIDQYAHDPEALRTMDRRRFEELVACLFERFGFQVELTAQTRDGGRDVIAIRHDIATVKYLIECKRPDPGGYVGVAPVRELLGVKTDEGATMGIMATTARFSPDARLLLDRHPWTLEGRDYQGVLEWLEEAKLQKPSVLT